MEQWVLLRKGADFEGIGKRFQISPRLACLIRNRDVIGDEAIAQYLNGTIADLYDGMLMKDMDKAVDILREKIAEQKRIRVIGDYDIDGVNATYILLEGLEKLGAEVDSDIPSRMKDGYGLNVELIERAYRDGIDTIITCDNGIAAAGEIAYGKRLGMTIVVTDHHEVPFEEEEDGKKFRIWKKMGRKNISCHRRMQWSIRTEQIVSIHLKGCAGQPSPINWWKPCGRPRAATRRIWTI